MTGAYQIEGYAIVSQDGMLADANGVMPDSLKFKADYAFFEAALDAVDLVLHGRHSQEQQPLAAQRRRLILTQRIAGIAADPSNPNALLWNPSGASFEDAVAAVGLPVRRVGVIGGTDVFALFLDRFDAFHLTWHAPNACCRAAARCSLMCHGLRPRTCWRNTACTLSHHACWMRRTTCWW